MALFPRDGVGIVQFANAHAKLSANVAIMTEIANVALGAQLSQTEELIASVSPLPPPLRILPDDHRLRKPC